ncbi:MAG TPA: prepilin-type N-terminal cleavage/methylation domain-containing protein [Tepidisphaeraceae bacterium]|jgi:prepilin-type N-terminal cleavage/methylation domain-containing protein/prepilin-type processing-associated H-X9-DG protein
MPRSRRSAFTLVELLVVIGIIALLISILLPSLNSARGMARSIKSAANMRSIGQAMQFYLNNYKQTYPAAYIYEGMTINGGTQLPATSDKGYRHVSSFLYGNETIQRNATETYGLGQRGSIPGSESFRNPQIDNGGLPPTNASADNKDPDQTPDTADVVDYQAPRIGYIFNEAICPKNKFVVGFQGSTATPYQFVKTSAIRNSSGTILATEVINDWRIVSGAPRGGGGSAVCKSHRPLHGFNWKVDRSNAGVDMEKMTAGTTEYFKVRYDDLYKNTPSDFEPTGTKSRLDWVGRYAGQGSWEKKRTNFLYVDGHVETKHIKETMSDTWEWGDKMYSLRTTATVSQN